MLSFRVRAYAWLTMVIRSMLSIPRFDVSKVGISSNESPLAQEVGYGNNG